MKEVIVYTDGACSGNPGPGGWAALLQCAGKEKELSGGEGMTTNNRMELMGAIMALKSLKEPCRVELHTDSTYVMKGMTEWVKGWAARGWKTADKKPVKNVELWLELVEAAKIHKVTWKWVKAHNGHKENDRVDALAVERSQEFKKMRGNDG